VRTKRRAWRVDDWFRPVNRDGSVRERRRRSPTPRDRATCVIAIAIILAFAGGLLLATDVHRALRVIGFPLAYTIPLALFLVRTRHLGWRGSQPRPLPPASRREKLALGGAGLLAAVVVVATVVLLPPTPATAEQCRNWLSQSRNIVLPEEVRQVFTERLAEGGCPTGP
jgi:hypothetical protein